MKKDLAWLAVSTRSGERIRNENRVKREKTKENATVDATYEIDKYFSTALPVRRTSPGERTLRDVVNAVHWSLVSYLAPAAYKLLPIQFRLWHQLASHWELRCLTEAKQEQIRK